MNVSHDHPGNLYLESRTSGQCPFVAVSVSLSCLVRCAWSGFAQPSVVDFSPIYPSIRIFLSFGLTLDASGLTDADADASGPDVMLASLDLSRPTVGSQSSTAVNSNSESYSGSLMTLLPDDHPVHFADPSDDPIALLKESIRYTSPIVRAMSPAASPYPISPRGKSKGLPFSPEDLTRALIAVQVCA